jgi:hypothetical protein
MMTFEEWEETYKPVANIFDANASVDGLMFETYGRELEQVRIVAAWDAGKVWTLLDCDGDSYISAGMHFVNRLGYFITSVSFDAANPPNDFAMESEAE